MRRNWVYGVFYLLSYQDTDIPKDYLENPEIIIKYYLYLRQNFPKCHFFLVTFFKNFKTRKYNFLVIKRKMLLVLNTNIATTY